MKRSRSTEHFLFVGNQTCLDFVNTEMIKDGRRVDLLQDFSELMAWMVQAHILAAKDAREAVTKWGQRQQGLRAFERAREFRKKLRHMVDRIVGGRAVPQEAVDAINVLLRHHPGYAEIAKTARGFQRRYHLETEEADHLLTPLAESASDLLTQCDHAHIKRCRNRECILYFYDVTKNHGRQWCSMAICGNRVKVAAHYHRKRARQ